MVWGRYLQQAGNRHATTEHIMCKVAISATVLWTSHFLVSMISIAATVDTYTEYLNSDFTNKDTPVLLHDGQVAVPRQHSAVDHEPGLRDGKSSTHATQDGLQRFRELGSRVRIRAQIQLRVFRLVGS